jgi:5-(carboxyamino)imidazole ribonucleotide synthase
MSQPRAIPSEHRAAPSRSRAPVVGILGGGQLARMTAQAAFQLGCEVIVLERDRHSPAAHLATRTVLGDWDDPESLLKLAALADLITLENEFVEAESLAVLERHGYRLWPASHTVQTVQDKLRQKQTLARAGLPVPRFLDAPNPAAALAAAEQLGWPLLLKKCRNAYDGKGNVTVRSPAELQAAWQRLDGHANALYVEQFCPFQMELAVMVTRAQNGAVVTYPVVQTIQRNHICHTVKAPAPLPPALAARATEIARAAIETVAGVGTMAVEMFLGPDGEILINEIAPRPHNSGHYSIEACACSQFENHIRAIFGWPLGSTAMRAPAAAMINLLATRDGPGEPAGLPQALAVPAAHVHIYGKRQARPGRKMGHITALGPTIEQAAAIVEQAARFIEFGLQK